MASDVALMVAVMIAAAAWLWYLMGGGGPA